MVPVRPSDERGFTLVEMLVVVLIVAILAAIAVAILTNQRTKAQDTEAKTTATVVATALTIWHQDHGTYAGAGRTELARIEPAIATARGLAGRQHGDRAGLLEPGERGRELRLRQVGRLAQPGGIDRAGGAPDHVQ